MKRYYYKGITEITEKEAEEIKRAYGRLAGGTQVIIENDGKIAYGYEDNAENCINRLYYMSFANISNDDNNNDVVKTIRAYQSYLAQIFNASALKAHRLYYVDNMSIEEIKDKIKDISVEECVRYFVSVAQSFLNNRETNIAKFEAYRKENFDETV